MSDPRLCIVGAGNLSTRRIYPYIGAAGAELVGVCDLDERKAQQNARRFGGRAYTDLDAMLDAESPTGVIICVGPAGHAKLAQHVLQRGIPVYTEKPPAPTAAEALVVARCAAERNLLCMTAFKKRYATAYERARAFIESFPPDTLLSVGVDYASGAYPNDRPERSFLLDFAIHLIDLVGYLAGDAREVFAYANGGSAFAVSIEFTSGAVGSLNLTDGRSFSIPTEEVEITLRGGNGMTIHNSSAWKIIQDGKCTEWREPSTFTSAGDSGHDTGHLAEIAAFVSALSTDEPTRSNIYASYKSMVLYEAILHSATTRRPVAVEYET